jgi:hypothetical protein
MISTNQILRANLLLSVSSFAQHCQLRCKRQINAKHQHSGVTSLSANTLEGGGTVSQAQFYDTRPPNSAGVAFAQRVHNLAAVTTDQIRLISLKTE